jgi:hypothetical protein
MLNSGGLHPQRSASGRGIAGTQPNAAESPRGVGRIGRIGFPKTDP